MKLLEVLESLNEAYLMYGNINIEICRFSQHGEKHYWLTSAFYRDGHFFMGFNPDPYQIRGDKHVGKNEDHGL
jgi:hypothetical protein